MTVNVSSKARQRIRLTGHNHPILGASGWGAVSASRGSASTAGPAQTAASGAPPAPGELNAQPVAIVVVSIPAVNGIPGVPSHKTEYVSHSENVSIKTMSSFFLDGLQRGWTICGTFP